MPRESAIAKAHKTYIGASMAAAVCGVSPWESPYALYQSMVGEAPPREETFPMWLGTQMEGIVIRAFTRETGLKVRRPRKKLDAAFLAMTEEFGFPMGALLDGITVDSTGDCVVEAKTGSIFTRGDWGDEVPLHYWFQCQHQLAVTGWRRVYVPVILGNAFLYHIVERDQELITLLIDREREFWGCVQRREPPVIDGSDSTTRAIRHQWRTAQPDVSKVINDPEVDRMVEVYVAQGSLIKEMEQERDKYKNRIIDQIREAESIVTPHYKVTYKNSTRRNVDVAALREAHPEVAEEFTVSSETRTFRATRRKDVTDA